MLRYHVPDMTCGHCSKVITQAIGRLDPQAPVQIDLSQKTVQVPLDASQSEAVMQAIRDAGYTPEPQ